MFYLKVMILISKVKRIKLNFGIANKIKSIISYK